MITLALVAVSVVAYLPLGVFLQWYLPGDGPYELVPLALAVSAVVGAGLCRRAASPGIRRMAVLLAVPALLVFLQVLLPSLSRRVGPWHALRTILVTKSAEVSRVAHDLGVPVGGAIPAELIPVIENRVLNPKPQFTFPFIQKTVRVSIRYGLPPYVGVEYGRGRNCAFELRGMSCISAD